MSKPDVTALRADYDEKWDTYDRARQKALASVEHLRIEATEAHTRAVKAHRSEL